MADIRRRYFHAAVPVTALGTNEPLERSGVRYGALEATAPAHISLAVPGGAGKHILGYLNPGVWWGASALICHGAYGAITAMVQLEESAVGAADPIQIIAAGSLAATGVLTTVQRQVPTTQKRLLSVTLSGVASANPKLTLIVNPTVPEWS